MSNWKLRYASFNSVKEFKSYLNSLNPSVGAKKVIEYIHNDMYDGLSSKKLIDFLGSDDLDKIKTGVFDTFLDTELVKMSSDLVKSVSTNIKFGDSFKKKRIKAIDRPQGAFSFSLATKGLYKDFEFYIDELKLVVESNVEKDSNGNYIYHHTDGEYYEAELRDKRNPLTGKAVYKTRTKKVYLKRQNKSNTKKVSIFIPVGGNADQTPDSLMYRCLPSLILSEILEKSGVKVGLYFARASAWGKVKTFFTTKIKDYGDKVNYNKILIYTSDPRYFRFETFKTTTLFYDGSVTFNLRYRARTLFGEEYSEEFNRWKGLRIAEKVKKDVSSTTSTSVLKDSQLVKKSGLNIDTYISPDIMLDPASSKEYWIEEILYTVIINLCVISLVDGQDPSIVLKNFSDSQKKLIEKGLIKNKKSLSNILLKKKVKVQMNPATDKANEILAKFNEAVDNRLTT